MSSPNINKYSEGYPNARYYAGNEVIDKIELLALKRSLSAFGLSQDQWLSNVQSITSCSARLSILTSILDSGASILTPHRNAGGHTNRPEARYFSTTNYSCTSDGKIDYDSLKQQATSSQAKTIHTESFAQARHIDLPYIRKVADSIGAKVVAEFHDQYSLISDDAYRKQVFDNAHFVSMDFKSSGGPRVGLILYRQDLELADALDFAVFPMLHGGPHNHNIAALAGHLRKIESGEFKSYA